MRMLEHCIQVVLKFPNGLTDIERVFDTLMMLEDLLNEAVELEGVGYVDGHEFLISDYEDDEVRYFIYGDSVDAIFDVVFPYIFGLPYLGGSYILKQVGSYEKIIYL